MNSPVLAQKVSQIAFLDYCFPENDEFLLDFTPGANFWIVALWLGSQP